MSAYFYIPFGWVHWHDVAVIPASSTDIWKGIWDHGSRQSGWRGDKVSEMLAASRVETSQMWHCPQDQWQVLFPWINGFIRNVGFMIFLGLVIGLERQFQLILGFFCLFLFKRLKEESKFWKEGAQLSPFSMRTVMKGTLLQQDFWRTTHYPNLEIQLCKGVSWGSKLGLKLCVTYFINSKVKSTPATSYEHEVSLHVKK